MLEELIIPLIPRNTETQWKTVLLEIDRSFTGCKVLELIIPLIPKNTETHRLIYLRLIGPWFEPYWRHCVGRVNYSIIPRNTETQW